MALLRFARSDGNALLLALKVVPGAKRSQIGGFLGDRLKVRVSAPPEDGRANAAVCQLLQGWLGARSITIVTGHTQSAKVARVEGVTEQMLRAKLEASGLALE